MEDKKPGTGSEITVIPEEEISIYEPSPMEMATSFMNSGGDLATLEKMMSLQREHDAYQAKKAFTRAMAEFKANPPTIGKDKRVAYKQTNYSHASLGNVTKQINKSLGEHGLSASWPLEQDNAGIKVTCTITHELGHSESTSLTAPSDSTGSKNTIQAMGSTISYLQRYTILALTGLATEDQDDDGITAEVRYIDERQISEITDLLNSNETIAADQDAFMKWAGIETVETIKANDYGRVISAIKGAGK